MAIVFSLILIRLRARFGAAGIAAYDLRGAIHIRGPVMAGGGLKRSFTAIARSGLGAVRRSGFEVVTGIAGLALAVLVVIFDFFNTRISSCIVNAGCAADGADFVRSPVVTGAFGETKIEVAI